MTEMLEEIKKMRFDKMRLGQDAPTMETIPSLPEVRVALVPLTEGEYDECLEMASIIEAPDNPAGFLRRDRRTNAEMMIRAIRNPSNPKERIFSNIDDLRNTLEVADLNFLTDCYMELVAKSSPHLDGFSEEELEDAKKVLAAMDWNGLSGRSWYALRRFLFTVGEKRLLARSLGLSSMSSSTATKNEDESTSNV